MTSPTNPTSKPPTSVVKIFIYVLVSFFALIGVASLFHDPTPAPAPPVPAPPAAAATPSAPAPPPPAEDASAKPAAPPSQDIDYLTLKAAAEDKLRTLIVDDQGVRYRNVETRLSTLDGTGIVAFCGEVNARTPMGGYGGFKRFIASQSVAITEESMTPSDFEQAWGQFCSGGVVGPKIWF